MVPDIKVIIQKAIAHHLDFDEAFVFLFGSRASGHEKKTSDYDIGIYTGKPVSLSCTFRSIRQVVPISNRQVNPIQFVNS